MAIQKYLTLCADLFAALGALARRLDERRDLLLLLLRDLLVLADGDAVGAFGTFAARFFLRDTDRLAERIAALGAFALRLEARRFFDPDLLGVRLGAFGTLAARRFLREAERVLDLFAALGAFALRFLLDLERDLLRDLLVLGLLFGALGTLAARRFLRDTERLADLLAALGALARRLVDLLRDLLAVLLLLVLGDLLGALGTLAARFLREPDRLAERFLAARGALARLLVDLDLDFEVLGKR